MVTRSRELAEASRLLTEAQCALAGSPEAASLVARARSLVVAAFEPPDPYEALAHERFKPTGGGWS